MYGVSITRLYLPNKLKCELESFEKQFIFLKILRKSRIEFEASGSDTTEY